MKFNGIDPRTLHRGISINKEIPPGTVTSQLETLAGADGEIIAGRTIKQGEYVVRMNIAGKTPEEGWQIRQLIAGWARAADEVTRKLIPSKQPNVYYDAILKEISPPEFVRGFVVVDVIFTVPRPVAMSVKASTAEGIAPLTATIGGTTWTKPAITLTMLAGTGTTIEVDGKTLLAITGEFRDNDFVFIYTDPPNVVLMAGGPQEDINSRVDYIQTDFEALCKAFKPGTHTIEAANAYSITLQWRDCWL